MRVSSATRTRIISSPEPGTYCIGPPAAQVPASSKNRTGHTSERQNRFAPTQISWSQKVEKSFVLSGEVNVNQRQDDNGATGTTPRSLSQVPRGCNGTVKVLATFVYSSLTSGVPDFRCSGTVTVCDLFEPTSPVCPWYGVTDLISCDYSDPFNLRARECRSGVGG